ncbi:hypothetical protein ACPA0F_09105 [Solibacillus silvestris]
MAYKASLPFSVPMYLLIPTYSTVNGVKKKTFPAATQGILFFGTFKTYGGTERESNGLYSVEDTANIETWFTPEITSGCAIALANNPTAVYEIIGEPENIEMRNQFLLFKVSRIKGGA